MLAGVKTTLELRSKALESCAQVRLDGMERLYRSGNWGNDGILDTRNWPTARSLRILNTVWHTADGGPRQ